MSVLINDLPKGWGKYLLKIDFSPPTFIDFERRGAVVIRLWLPTAEVEALIGKVK